MSNELLELLALLERVDNLDYGETIPSELLNDIASVGDTIAVSPVLLPTADIVDYKAVNGRLIPIDSTRKYPIHKATLEKSVKLMREADNLPVVRELSAQVKNRLADRRELQKIVLYSSGHNVLDYEYGQGDTSLANNKAFNAITHNLKSLTINVKRVESRNGRIHYYCDCIGLYAHSKDYTEEKLINWVIHNASKMTAITDNGRLILTHFNPSQLAIFLWLSGNELRPDMLPFQVDIIGRFRAYDAKQYLAELTAQIEQRKEDKIRRKTWRDNWRKINRTSSQIRRDNKNAMIARAIKNGNIELANHIASLPLSYTCFR